MLKYVFGAFPVFATVPGNNAVYHVCKAVAYIGKLLKIIANKIKKCEIPARRCCYADLT